MLFPAERPSPKRIPNSKSQNHYQSVGGGGFQDWPPRPGRLTAGLSRILPWRKPLRPSFGAPCRRSPPITTGALLTHEHTAPSGAIAVWTKPVTTLEKASRSLAHGSAWTLLPLHLNEDVEEVISADKGFALFIESERHLTQRTLQQCAGPQGIATLIPCRFCCWGCPARFLLSRKNPHPASAALRDITRPRGRKLTNHRTAGYVHKSPICGLLPGSCESLRLNEFNQVTCRSWVGDLAQSQNGRTPPGAGRLEPKQFVPFRFSEAAHQPDWCYDRRPAFAFPCASLSEASISSPVAHVGVMRRTVSRL